MPKSVILQTKFSPTKTFRAAKSRWITFRKKCQNSLDANMITWSNDDSVLIIYTWLRERWFIPITTSHAILSNWYWDKRDWEIWFGRAYMVSSNPRVLRKKPRRSPWETYSMTTNAWPIYRNRISPTLQTVYMPDCSSRSSYEN